MIVDLQAERESASDFESLVISITKSLVGVLAIYHKWLLIRNYSEKQVEFGYANDKG